jgi:hypothetical protein
MLTVIFFEETAICNIIQAGTKGALGAGFGQLEMSSTPREFFAWLGMPTDYREVAKQMLADKDLAIKVHCKYFQWLVNERGKGLDGCLSAQVGSHTEYIDLFKVGATLFENAWKTGDRSACIMALNHARSKSPKHNNIPEHLFAEFWEFILPSSWVKGGLAKAG